MLRYVIVVASLFVIALLTLAAEDGCGTSDDGGGAPASGESPAAGAPTDQPPAAQETTVAEEPQETGFGDGTYVVGQDVQPGTYRTEGGEFCYLARLSGLGGTIDEIITNDNGSGPQIVAIAPTDVGFETSGCGEWIPDTGQTRPDQSAPFGDGVYAVGRDISAGTWRSEGAELCYWARHSSFGRTLDDIIANDNASGAAVVAIDPSDAAFETSGCGQWTKMQ